VTAFHFALLGVALGLGGCGEADAPCGPGIELTVREPETASLADVQAILGRSCAVGGCHASAPGAGGLALPQANAAWVDSVVGVRSQQNPSMDLVAPGDPERSWLLYKISGDLCGFTCDAKLGCGGQMPFGQPLAEEERGVIRGWIRHGASSN
jgi:hypothetical protein